MYRTREDELSSTSHWQAEFADIDNSRSARGPLAGDTTADVVILGAGITGTSAALWLARAGTRVAVLEARYVAAGASGRNGGFLLSGTSESYGTAVAHYGRERTRRIWGYSVANAELARTCIGELAESGWDCGFRQNGSLRIASSEGELAEILAGIPLMREDGWRAEPVDRTMLAQRIQAAYFGGAYYPLDGEIQPARFVAGLARLAERAGAIIYEESPATVIEASQELVTVRTAAGSITAGALLLATNAWTPEFAGRVGADWLGRTITPTRGQMLVTAPVTERVFECPYYADEGYQYWRQLADGRLAVGGWRNQSFETETSLDETPADSVQRHLDGFVHETLGLSDTPIERRWAGIMAFSTDGLPLIGRLPGTPRVYIAAGYTGHGNAYALHASRVVADLLQGRAHPDADLFDPARLAGA